MSPSRGIYKDEWIRLGDELDVRGEGGGVVKKGAGVAAGWRLVPGSPGEAAAWGDTMQGHETSRYTVY